MRAEAFIIDERFRNNKTVIKLIEQLNLEYTGRQSMQKEVDLRLYEVNRLRDQLREKEIKQNQLVMDIAVMVMSLNRGENEQQQHDIMGEIFLEDQEEQEDRRRLRATLNELASIVAFTYCNDNTNRLTNEQLDQIDRHLA